MYEMNSRSYYSWWHWSLAADTVVDCVITDDYRFFSLKQIFWLLCDIKSKLGLKSVHRDVMVKDTGGVVCSVQRSLACMHDPSQRDVFGLRIMRSIWFVFLDSWQVLTFEARHIWQRGLSLLLENACGNILTKSHLTDRVSAQTIYQLILLKRLCWIV